MSSVAVASEPQALRNQTALGPSANPLVDHLRAGRLDKHSVSSPLVACLLPLLEELHWNGTPRRLFEALPHLADGLTIEEFRGVLARLGYRSVPQRLRLKDLDQRFLPCLFEADDGRVFVVRERCGETVSLFDGAIGTWHEEHCLTAKGKAYFLEPLTTRGSDDRSSSTSWLLKFVGRFRPLITLLFAVTFISNLFALAVPLFIMGVYDQVIAAGSTETLRYFLGGMAIALLADTALRFLRARALSYIGARLDILLGSEVFGQVLNLPLRFTQNASVGAQVTRLRQFETLRDFFTGPLAGVVFDLPFVGVFIVAIGLLAGPLVWVPLALLVAFLLLAAVMAPLMRRRLAEGASAGYQRQSFLIELFSQHRSIRDCHVEDVWRDRFREVSARHARAFFRTQQLNLSAQTLAQLLMMAAGIATLWLGTLEVMAGAMSGGALIAVMALTWRVLAPLQVGFLGLTRLEQIRLAITQIDRLLKMETEYDATRTDLLFRSFKGDCGFHRVSFRYANASEPTLLGVNLNIPAKQCIAIAGSSGAGKSTLLKLLAGLYEPQSGFVTIDALDIRQIDKRELRASFGYCPQRVHLFHGTVSQNIRFANPTASDAEVTKAAMDAGLMEDILSLPDGFETRLTEAALRHVSESFKHQLMLARAYVTDAPIYLFDEAAASLDQDGDERFRKKLQALSKQSTVIMVTHRPSLMRLADRIVYLHEGQILFDGKPDEVLPFIEKLK